jgi:glycosyltransferase involved in cell wall biosynthesis
MCLYPALFLKKIFKIPLILDYIDIGTVHAIDVLLKFRHARNADSIFAISHFLEKKAQRELEPSRVYYIPIFVDTDRFSTEPGLRSKARARFGIGDDMVFIGYSGSYWEVEGVSLLLKAFGSVVSRYPLARLGLIGSYEKRPHYEDIPATIHSLGLESEVILIPKTAREDIPGLLSAFDILCCPKRDCEVNRAANPVKVVEYLAMGVPSICSGIGGIKDIIRDGENGFLVSPDNWEELAEKIIWTIENPEISHKVGSEGRNSIIRNYSLDSIARKVKMILDQTLEPREI